MQKDKLSPNRESSYTRQPNLSQFEETLLAVTRKHLDKVTGNEKINEEEFLESAGFELELGALYFFEECNYKAREHVLALVRREYNARIQHHPVRDNNQNAQESPVHTAVDVSPYQNSEISGKPKNFKSHSQPTVTQNHSRLFLLHDSNDDSAAPAPITTKVLSWEDFQAKEMNSVLVDKIRRSRDVGLRSTENAGQPENGTGQWHTRNHREKSNHATARASVKAAKSEHGINQLSSPKTHQPASPSEEPSELGKDNWQLVPYVHSRHAPAHHNFSSADGGPV